MPSRSILALDDEIVESMYSAATGLVPWNIPLGGIFKVFKLRSMQLVFVDKKTGALLSSEQPAELFDQGAVQGTLEHIREWAKFDPHVAAVAQMPVGVVYDSERAGAPQQYALTSFYQEYWPAYQNRGVLAAKVADDDAYGALIGLVRSFWHPAFSVDEGKLFSRYCRHLSAALRVGRYVDTLRTGAIAGRALLEAAEHPMLLLDAGLGIKAFNKAAANLLREGSVFFERDGVLTCWHAEDTERLREAMASLRTGSARASRAAIRLAVTSGRPLLSTLWYLQPEVTMSAFGRQPAVLMSVVATSPGETIEPAFLEALFDLTPTESRVAIALQAGSSLPEIAAARRVSTETIRSQVRSIYAKTGVQNRSRLVQILAQLTRP